MIELKENIKNMEKIKHDRIAIKTLSRTFKGKEYVDQSFFVCEECP
jgi:hypothetical protein